MNSLLNWSSAFYNNWQKDRIPSMSAAVAYYTLFSLAPILLICISVAGTLFGEQAAQGQILGQVEGLLGKQTALEIQAMIQNINQPTTASIARIFSIIILLFTTSSVFSEIQAGLNAIWEVKSKTNKKWYASIKNRFISFVMVLVSAFLLLISLVLSALLAVFSGPISYLIGTNIIVALLISDGFSFLIVTLLFAMMYKNLPDVRLRWRDIWIGALIASLLFSLGKILINIYLNHAHIASAFGASASLIILLIWIYYSAQIFFLGAEVIKTNVDRKEIKVKPRRDAVSL